MPDHARAIAESLGELALGGTRERRGVEFLATQRHLDHLAHHLAAAGIEARAAGAIARVMFDLVAGLEQARMDAAAKVAAEHARAEERRRANAAYLVEREEARQLGRRYREQGLDDIDRVVRKTIAERPDLAHLAEEIREGYATP